MWQRIVIGADFDAGKMNKSEVIEFLLRSDVFPNVFADIAVGKVPSIMQSWCVQPEMHYSWEKPDEFICPLFQAVGGGDFFAYDLERRAFFEWDYETGFVRRARTYQGVICWMLLNLGIDGIYTDEELEEIAVLLEYEYWPELLPTLDEFLEESEVHEYFREIVAKIDERDQ